MTGSLRIAASAAVAAAALASCSGGGSTTNAAPHAAASSAGKAQANITIRYTQGLHRLQLAPRAGRRVPRFVDPAGSVLAVQSNTTSNASFVTSTQIPVAPAPDGTQSISAPIVSSPGGTDATLVDVAEFDSNGDALALGFAALPSVQPGTIVTPAAITLYMIPFGIGITTRPATGTDALALSQDPQNPTSFQPGLGCPGTAYLFAFDAQGSWASQFGTPLGQGGIPTPQIVTQASDGGGTSRLVTVQGGGIQIVPDQGGHGVRAHVQTYDINPADNNYAQSTSDGYVDFLPPSC